jgi:hypothetical protein
MVFGCYWLYMVGSGIGDPKYLYSDVFGRYFEPTKTSPYVGWVISIHNFVETCKFPRGSCEFPRGF